MFTEFTTIVLPRTQEFARPADHIGMASSTDNWELSMRSRIPNALSLLRIAFSLVVIVVSRHLNRTSYITTVGLLAMALATDVSDGYLARKWNVRSETGYILDSLGDRAIHLALVLVFLVRYDFHPLFAWLIVFRDIAIFAVRVLSKAWLQEALKLQWVSRLHGIILRIWLGLFLVRDGFQVFSGSDMLDTLTFAVTETTLLCTTIVISYIGLAVSFGRLIEYDHKTLF